MGRNMDFDSNDDSNSSILTQTASGQIISIGVEHIKSAYIVEGCSAADLAARFLLPVGVVERVIAENKLDELRAAHVKHGLAKLQSMQLVQAEKLMDIETQFKKIRIIQLEKSLEDYLAYYSRHGHFYKVHPVTLDILKDTNGIPIQIKIPNVGPEISQLKESVSLSEGLKQLLGNIDAIINNNGQPKDTTPLNPSVIDVTNFDGLFQKKKSEDDE